MAEVQCQQPKQRRHDWLLSAAAVIETFYEPTPACDWMPNRRASNVAALAVISLSFNCSYMLRDNCSSHLVAAHSSCASDELDLSLKSTGRMFDCSAIKTQLHFFLPSLALDTFI